MTYRELIINIMHAIEDIDSPAIISVMTRDSDNMPIMEKLTPVSRIRGTGCNGEIAICAEEIQSVVNRKV